MVAAVAENLLAMVEADVMKVALMVAEMVMIVVIMAVATARQ